MFSPLIAAGILCILLGLVHSFMGEALIFRRGEVTSNRFRGIIWATWHLATLLAFGLAAILILTPREILPMMGRPLCVIAACLAMSGVIVLGATKGRHPGWVVLCVISGLIFAGL